MRRQLRHAGDIHVMACIFVLAVAAGDLTLYPLIQLRLGTVLPVAVAALAVWGARSTTWRRPVPLLLLLFAGVAVCWAPIALGRAPDPDSGRTEVQGLIAGAAVAVTVAALSRCSERGLLGLRRGWSMALGLSVVVGAVEFATHRHLWVDPSLSWAQAHPTIIAGAFRNPNDFAIALSVMVSGTLADAAGSDRTARRWLLPLVVLGACEVALTQSRSGALALLLVLAAHAVSAMRRSVLRVSGARRLPVATLTCALAVAALASVLVPALATRNPVVTMAHAALEPGTARSDALRLDLIRAALRYFGASDGLGTGAASFEILLARDPAPGVASRTWLHNTFLEVLLQYGVAPAAAMLALLLAVVLTVVRRSAPPASRAGTARTTRPVRIARAEAVGAVIAFAAFGCASATVLTTPVWWLTLGQAAASAWWLAARPHPGSANAEHAQERLRHDPVDTGVHTPG